MMTFTELDVQKVLDHEGDEYCKYFNDIVLENKATLNGENEFKIIHQDMVEQWNEQNDYELGILEKGICKTCCLFMYQMHHPKEVITQVGVARFGLRVGICVSCINMCVNMGKINELSFKIPFQSSDDQHEMSVTFNLLDKLVKREYPIGDTEAERPLNDLYKSVLRKILESYSNLLEKANKEQSKEVLCKQCRKLKIEDQFVEVLNQMRKAKKVAGCCLGCSTLFCLTSGCSMATCDRCISKTKTCGVCMEGASGLSHDLITCSEKMKKIMFEPENAKPLPDLMKCECKEQTISDPVHNFENHDASQHVTLTY